MYLFYFNRFSVLFSATLTSDTDIVSILFQNVLRLIRDRMYIAMQNLRSNAIKDSKHEDLPCENSKNHCKESGKYSLMRKFKAHVSFNSVVHRTATFNTVGFIASCSNIST